MGAKFIRVAHSLTDSTFYIRIPSFAVGVRNEVEAIVSKHAEAIASRSNLIIDIRGNTGGQDEGWLPLLPLIYTGPYESKGVEWYASDGNIKFFEHALANDGIREGGEEWTRMLIEEMKRHRGGFVIHPMDSAGRTVKYDTVHSYPRKVGIIIGNKNASAAEQFLLAAKNSKKVTLFGSESTAGTLDYSNTVPHTLPSDMYELCMPMTRSLRLPENPIDNTGIVPDVKIPYPARKDLYDRVDDQVYFTMYYLEMLEM